MKVFKRFNFKQYLFYTFVFLFGFLFQPNWVRDNFWLKADFYDSLPFQFPYFLFLTLYASISVVFSFQIIKIFKKYL